MYCLKNVLIAGVLACVVVSALAADVPSPPTLKALLQEKLYRQVMSEREIVSHAKLEDLPPEYRGPLAPAQGQSKKPDLKRYRFLSSMLVKAPLEQTRLILTNYELYKQMVPYIDRIEMAEGTSLLQVEGGIWKFKMRSAVEFEDIAKNWIKFRIVSGHFTGLTGEMVFESKGEQGTAVYFGGEARGSHWPPRFVLERGAEIVFGYTAKRMRSYVESHKLDHPTGPRKGLGKGNSHDDAVPQPRSRL